MMIIRGTMSPYEVYTTYLALKKHFSDKKYDYHKYRGKTRTSKNAFNARRDRYFFEKMSRKLSEEEVKLFFLASFISTDNPSSVWVGEIIRSGEKNFQRLIKTHQSLSYIFSNEINDLFGTHKLSEIFNCSQGHPPILKGYLRGDVSIETMVILDQVFGYSKDLDRKLGDPVWEVVSMKIRKYKPFLNIEIDKYKKILRNVVYV